MRARTSLVLAVAALLAAVVIAVPVEPHVSKLSEEVIAALKVSKNVDVMIRMAEKANPIELISRVRLESRAAKATFVRDSMMTIARETQREVLDRLVAANMEHKSFWINNAIFVKGATEGFLHEIASRLDIDIIDIPNVEQIHTPLDLNTNVTKSNGNEWGVEKINAHKVWASGNRGANVVVANIDTGVRWTHEALVGSYRGSAVNNNGVATHDYNWLQPTGGAKAPADNNGHGSHVMGTIAGTNGVGVAPEAKWIACQGCGVFGCSEYDLTTCAEFLTCPTDLNGENADCSKAPNVINNSWGGGQGRDWYDSLMQAWIAADIVPVFAMGNSGSRCGTANSPGDSQYTTAVGATDINDVLAYFSSRGPSVFTDGRIKPEVSAPGLNIRSAWYTSDTAYSSISGTSMAAPHVAGTVALLLSTSSKATIAQIVSDLETTAATNMPAPTQGEKSCGGISYDVSPNFLYGYGRIDACAAVLKEGGKCEM